MTERSFDEARHVYISVDRRPEQRIAGRETETDSKTEARWPSRPGMNRRGIIHRTADTEREENEVRSRSVVGIDNCGSPLCTALAAGAGATIWFDVVRRRSRVRGHPWFVLLAICRRPILAPLRSRCSACTSGQIPAEYLRRQSPLRSELQ